MRTKLKQEQAAHDVTRRELEQARRQVSELSSQQEGNEDAAQSRAAEVERVRCELTEQLEAREAAHAAALAAANDKHAGMMSRVREAAEQEAADALRAQAHELERHEAASIEALQAEAETLRQAALRELQSASDAARVEAEERHAQQLAAALEEAMVAHAEGLAKQAAELEADKENVNAETRSHCDAVMAALSSDVERLRAAIAERDASLRAATEQAQRLQQENEMRERVITSTRAELQAERDGISRRLAEREEELRLMAERERTELRGRVRSTRLPLPPPICPRLAPTLLSRVAPPLLSIPAQAPAHPPPLPAPPLLNSMRTRSKARGPPPQRSATS